LIVNNKCKGVIMVRKKVKKSYPRPNFRILKIKAKSKKRKN